jgi:endonuclease/exonuclease/phosphatase family metal-dependent hydrolase
MQVTLDTLGSARANGNSTRGASLTSRVVRWFVTAAALCAAALALAFEFADETAWWVELARYVPYPVYLLPALLAAGSSLLLGWRWRLAGAATLALVIGPVMGLALGMGESGTGRLRVMTYNIKDYLAMKHVGSLAGIMWEIALHDPDIVVLQDAAHAGRVYRTDPKQGDRMFGGRQVMTSGQFVIASRLPLSNCRDGDVSFPGETHHYLRCTVVANGKEFELFNVHLLTPREGLNATRLERLGGIDEWQENLASRMFQARALARDVTAASRPVLLLGDLNAPEHSPVVRQLLTTGLRSAWATAGAGYGYTHGHSLRPHISFSRIDHVLADANFGVADVQVGGKDASEHRPVVADLWLKPQKSGRRAP